MSKVVRFVDRRGGACWARVDLDSGEPVWISIAQSGVLIKRSRLGILGAKLYHETDIHRCVDVARALDSQVEQYSAPEGMNNLMLRAFTQTALDSSSAAEFCARIGRARHMRVE